ncbi:NAD(P)H oxidoreductase YRKL (plasmid) [Sinorhizobium sojae CCBAU 05684]|uniref:NAD(P)H oxidoreductase YRKL n=1 Tax=Sinorhizobium sojae CCBAU 05684 TaxID=716928 RepID=A0A249PH98_9HYPH|nr:NAD(P)H oxidoreductase YRKL [Sinorhizobium sojae CCBAU 05684]
MRGLATAPPIPYRQQNGGDYLIPSMQLRPDVGEADANGFALHLNDEGRVPPISAARRPA